MGLCLSCRCGEAQHKPVTTVSTISPHPASLPSPPSRNLADPISKTHPTLKRFLHVYNNESNSDQSRKVFSSSPRLSLDDSLLVVPHSSELFSLRSEDSDDNDQSDRSISSSPVWGSITRWSTSSRLHSKSSTSDQPGGRFCKPPVPPRGRNAGSRKSAWVPARKSCSSLGQVELRHGQSLAETIARLEKLCDVKLFPESRTTERLVTHNSNSSPTTSHGSSASVLLHESCRDLAQKLFCLDTEHADELEPAVAPPAALPAVCVTSDAAEKQTMSATASFHTGEESLAAEPVDDAAVTSRLSSSRFFYDADENIQFTDFEATFDSPPLSETSTSHEADHPSSIASVSGENSAPRLGVGQPAHRRSRTSSDLGRVLHVKGSQQKGSKNSTLFQSALKDASLNVKPACEPPKLETYQPLQSPTSAVKKRCSRSLDFQNCSLSQLEFDVPLKSEQWQLPQGGTETLRSEETQRIEALDSASILQLAGAGEGNAASPTPDSTPSQSQSTKAREEEEQSLEDGNAGEETLNVHDIPDKSFSLAFDNFVKLLQSPPVELAQNTLQLLQLLGATTDTVELSADKVLVLDQLPSSEAKSQQDASTSMNTTEKLELPALLNTPNELEFLPEALLEVLPVGLGTDSTIAT